MRIISRARVNGFSKRHPDAREPLQRWYRLAKHANWSGLADARAIFPHVDMVATHRGNRVYVFNIAGTKYRLVAAIHFNTRVVFVLGIMTHADYSRGAWKETL